MDNQYNVTTFEQLVSDSLRRMTPMEVDNLGASRKRTAGLGGAGTLSPAEQAILLSDQKRQMRERELPGLDQLAGVPPGLAPPPGDPMKSMEAQGIGGGLQGPGQTPGPAGAGLPAPRPMREHGPDMSDFSYGQSVQQTAADTPPQVGDAGWGPQQPMGRKAGSDTALPMSTEDIDRLWEQDRTTAPPSQPRAAELDRRPNTPPPGEGLVMPSLEGAPMMGPAVEIAPSTIATPAPAQVPDGVVPENPMLTVERGTQGLPYSTPEQRPQPGPEATGAGLLAVPTPSTRQTGSSGKPSAEGAVDAANKLNIVQRLARDWFGVDTPEERARAKTYMAHWAAALATSKAGLGAFAEANLAGLDGVKEEEMRQLGIDMKREEQAMRREDVAYERTRDAKQDARQAQQDARQAEMDGYTIDEYQRKKREAREEDARRASDPFYGTSLDDGNVEKYTQILDMVRRQNPDWTPEQVRARAAELWQIENPPRASSGLGDLASILGQQAQ